MAPQLPSLLANVPQNNNSQSSSLNMSVSDQAGALTDYSYNLTTSLNNNNNIIISNNYPTTSSLTSRNNSSSNVNNINDSDN